MRATWWMAVHDNDKLDLLLLVRGEEFRKLLQTLPEQPTDYKSYMYIEMLDQHFKVNHNTLELYKWSPDMYFADFKMKSREQTLHCDFPITLDNAIIMMNVIKSSNVELWNEISTKNGDLKSVRETVKALEIASEVVKWWKVRWKSTAKTRVIQSWNKFPHQDSLAWEIKGRVVPLTPCRHRPGCLAPNAGMRQMSTRIHAQLLEGDASNVDVWTTLPT